MTMAPETIPPMVPPSVVTTAAFLAIVAALAVAFVVAVRRAGPASESPSRRATMMRRAAIGAIAWLAITGTLIASGALENQGPPPALMLFFVGSQLAAIAVALSPVGRRLAAGIPVVALIGFQAFRLPLELILHAWADEGVIPIQMTFSGHNFDIVTGVLAAAIWLAYRRRTPPRWVVHGFNWIGLGLLLTVATIAVRSSPIPLRGYFNDPPLLLGLHFPYGWIVPVCVSGALFGHLVVFRWLRLQPRA